MLAINRKYHCRKRAAHMCCVNFSSFNNHHSARFIPLIAHCCCAACKEQSLLVKAGVRSLDRYAMCQQLDANVALTMTLIGRLILLC